VNYSRIARLLSTSLPRLNASDRAAKSNCALLETTTLRYDRAQ
jgi:hypothetical protein